MSPRPVRKPAAPAGEAVILFDVAGSTFAIAASAVDEIRSLEGLEAFASPPLRTIRYWLQRGQRDCFVVETAAHFRLAASSPARLLVLRGSPIALLADSVERMTEIAAILPLPRAFVGEERLWYRGLALIAGRVFPVVDPAAFLSKSELALLQAAAARLRAQEASA